MRNWIDAPVQEEAQDELARGPFAALIADSLLAENKSRATVVGLTGGWGTGKSTVANFVVNRISMLDAEIPVVRFEPWMVSTSDALAREFFRELGRAILPKDDSKDSTEKRIRFYRYVAQVLDALALTSDAAQVANPAFGLVSKAVRGSKIAIDIAASGLEAHAEEPTLREARATISQALVELRHPVVVVIDDIDRLNAGEVRTVFQIIKACADFPNVRYLLLYDRGQVTHALKDTVNDAEAFLEKIVGQVFDLPLSTKKQRESVLARSLESLGIQELRGRPLDRFEAVFRSVLLPGLPTIRHVKRFVGTVASLLPGVIIDRYRNVDLADFLALEFLRQYVSDLYSVLREEETPTPGGIVREIAYSDTLAKKRTEARASAIPDDEPMKTLASEALTILGDDIEDFGGGRRAWSLRQHVERRFASEHWKPVYLGFQSGRAALKDEDWAQMRASLSPSAAQRKWIARLSTPEDRTIFARAVADRSNELTTEEAKQLLEVIVSWGEMQPSEPHHAFSNTINPMTAVWLIGTACLVKIAKKEDAVSALDVALSKTSSVGCIGYISGMEGELLRRASTHGDWSNAQQFAEFSKRLTLTLRETVESGRVFDHPCPDELLLAWHWLAEAEFATWFDAMSSNPQLLAKYVNKVMAVKRNEEGFSGWGGDLDTAFFKGLERLDDENLTDDGKWARDYCIKSMRRNATWPREDDGDNYE